MSSLQFNKDYLLIGDADRQEILILKHKSTHRVFKMSSAEYKILKWYSEGHSFGAIKSFLHEEFIVTDEVLGEIIASGAKLGLLVENRSLQSASADKGTAAVSKISYLFYLVLQRLNVNPDRIKLDSSSSFNLMKLLKWNPKQMTISQYKIGMLAFTLMGIMALIVFLTFQTPFLGWSQLMYQLGQLSLAHILFVSLPLSLIISLAHEYSHYVVYKYYGGIQNEIGFGLLYRVIPIFYTTTEDMIIWPRKSSKIHVALAGIGNDTIFILLCYLLVHQLDNGLARSLSSFVLFGLAIKMAYNLNPFSPGSDMYFVLVDLLDEKFSFSKIHDMVKDMFKGKKANITTAQMLYVILCYLSIGLYMISFLTMMTFPIWINYII